MALLVASATTGPSADFKTCLALAATDKTFYTLFKPEERKLLARHLASVMTDREFMLAAILASLPRKITKTGDPDFDIRRDGVDNTNGMSCIQAITDLLDKHNTCKVSPFEPSLPVPIMRRAANLFNMAHDIIVEMHQRAYRLDTAPSNVEDLPYAFEYSLRDGAHSVPELFAELIDNHWAMKSVPMLRGRLSKKFPEYFPVRLITDDPSPDTALIHSLKYLARATPNAFRNGQDYSEMREDGTWIHDLRFAQVVRYWGNLRVLKYLFCGSGDTEARIVRIMDAMPFAIEN